MHRPFRLTPPAVPADSLVRARLRGVLARRFELRLITIEAGAGFGKTTLLSQAVAQHHHAPPGRDCWLSCEPADSSPSTLLGALLESLGVEVEPGEVPTVDRVCEAVWSSTPEQVCIVLDDAHHLEAGSPGAAAVQGLLDGLPENGHLVVGGRRLPTLARSRLLLHGRAAELREADLGLDAGEVHAFATMRGVAPDVIAPAAGWPALAELYARAGAIGAERFVWEEVLESLPRREREVFLLLVALGGAGADLLESLAGGPFDRDRISALPLVQTDDRGGLRPHAVWEDLVGARIDAGAATAARRRLADGLLQTGDNGAAFEVLASTGDWEPALAAVFAACNDQQRPPRPDELERWRALIPTSVGRPPEATYLDAMIERARDPWSPSVAGLFAEAYGGFQATGDLGREATARVRALFPAWCRSDREMFDEMHERISALVEAGLPIENLALINRAIVADFEGRPSDVSELVSAMAPLEPRLAHLPGVLRAFAALESGNPAAARTHAEDAVAAAEAVIPAAGTGWALTVPSVVAWSSGDLLSALERLPGELGPRFTLAERVPALAMEAVAAAHVGDSGRARAMVAAIDALVPELGSRDLLAGFRAVAAATTAAAAGDEDGARRALDEGLGGRALDAGGAGRAIRWFPAMPYLFMDDARKVLDELPQGAARRRALITCRALIASRASGAPVPEEVFEDASALLTVLPAALATELVVRAGGDSPSAIHVGAIAALAELAPTAVRSALRRLVERGEPAMASALRALQATVPIPPEHHVRIEVLGTARLLRDGRVVDSPDWRRHRVRQLVCALVGLREIRRAQLGVMLWPEFDDKAVSANLRQTLNYLQTLLEPRRERGDAPWFLRQSAGTLGLRGDANLSVDAWDFERELDAADAAASTGMPSVELAHLLKATRLWRGDYLVDVAGEDWAEPLRLRVRQRFVRSAVRAGDLLAAAGRHDEAIAMAARALDVDPWCEAAMRLKVSAYAAVGDHGAARDAYNASLDALTDLGVTPDERVWAAVLVGIQPQPPHEANR